MYTDCIFTYVQVLITYKDKGAKECIGTRQGYYRLRRNKLLYKCYKI